jgi:hypothetical protein
MHLLLLALALYLGGACPSGHRRLATVMEDVPYERWPNGSYIAIDDAQALGKLRPVGDRGPDFLLPLVVPLPSTWWAPPPTLRWRLGGCVAASVLMLLPCPGRPIVCPQIRVQLFFEVANSTHYFDAYPHCRVVSPDCPEDAVVVPTATRFKQIASRLQWAAKFIENHVFIKPVQVCG